MKPSATGARCAGCRPPSTRRAYGGWGDRVELCGVVGSDRYLLGEETALLESLDGRPPFPRLAPPYRDGAEPAEATLVNNVETLANVPAIVADGPPAFRSMGTDESPGHDRLHGQRPHRASRCRRVRARHAAPRRDRAARRRSTSSVVAVLSGVAHPFLPADALDTPLTWEAMAAAGGGLGAAGFIVLDDQVDIVAVAHGVSRFLSRGVLRAVHAVQAGRAGHHRGARPPPAVDARTTTTSTGSRSSPPACTDGARCYLAQQHQNVVEPHERSPTRSSPRRRPRRPAARPIVPMAASSTCGRPRPERSPCTWTSSTTGRPRPRRPRRPTGLGRRPRPVDARPIRRSERRPT